MISALPHSERSRDAVCARSRSWRIYKQKHLLAPTQPLTLISSQAFTEWAEHKDAVCSHRLASAAFRVRQKRWALMAQLPSGLRSCFSVCMSSIRDGHLYWELISHHLFPLLLVHELLWSRIHTPLSFAQLKHYKNLTSTCLYQNQQRRLSK